MVKSIQIKIVMVFMILGIIVITGLGLTFIYQLNYINNEIATTSMSPEEVQQLLVEQVNQIRQIIYASLIVFTILIIILGAFIAKVVIKPISRLIKSTEMIANGEDIEIEHFSNNKNKSEIDELVEAFGVMNAGLKENLNEVTRQKKQIETILLHMTDGIVAFDMNGKVIHINLAAKKLLGITEEVDFESIFQRFDVDINLEKIIYLDDWTSSEKKLNFQNQAINLFFAPFKNENDRPGGVIVVVQDITEQEKLDNMRKEFVADVSHELKTPITSIMGYADTLIDSEVDEQNQKKFLERISSEAKRMSKLVADLLILSKYDTAKIKIEKTEFDLGELVKYIFEGQTIEMQKKNLTGECYVTADVPPVYADKTGIERVIINILSNAIKYTDDGGNITVYVGFVYNDAYIKIKDTGRGIPETELAKIFERFYRVDKDRARETGGTGLGLAIAKEILDQNDSKIDIKSEVGKGTDVIIRIPTKIK